MKLKVLETRQTSEDILLLSWSPRMDLLALVNAKGELSLHRLSWQRVWQWKGDTAAELSRARNPTHLTWHPEGIFIVVGYERTAIILDVETGKDVHRHELDDKFEFIQWSASKFDIAAMDEPPAPEPEPSNSTPSVMFDPDSELDDIPCETNLTMLLLGTCKGQIYVFTSGLLLTLILVVPTSPQAPRPIFSADCSSDLKYFHFLTTVVAPTVQTRNATNSASTSTPTQTTLALVQFYNDAVVPQLAPLLAPLGQKQITIRNSWSRIQNQLATLSEHWEKIVDIHTHYMTYAKSRAEDEVLADYTEILLAGTGSVELEFFLGSAVGTREKEAKKHLVTLTTAFAGLADGLAKIKQYILSLTMDLVEIEGFLRNITKHPSTGTLVADLRSTFAQLYYAVLHLKKRTQDFFNRFRHFMRLILNTVHVFHVVESGADLNEEDTDVDKVLEFLDTKVDKGLFEFLLENMRKEQMLTSREKMASRHVAELQPPPNPAVKFGDTTLFRFIGDSPPKCDWTSFAEYMAKHDKNDDDETPQSSTMPKLVDFSVEALGGLLRNSQLGPTVATQFNKLFLIPVINSTPFCKTILELRQIEDMDKMTEFSYGLHIDHVSGKTFVFVHPEPGVCTPERIFMFEYDPATNAVLECRIAVSRPLHSCQFFGGPTTHLTLLSYDPEDKRPGEEHAHGRTLLFQVPLRVTKGAFLPFVDKSVVKDISLQVPTDIYVPGPTTVTYIDQILPIDDFRPLRLAVSGPRKVGAVVGTNRRTVLLLEMDPVEGPLEAEEEDTETEADADGEPEPEVDENGTTEVEMDMDEDEGDDDENRIEVDD